MSRQHQNRRVSPANTGTMRAHTPQGQGEGGRRGSVGGSRFRASSGAGGLPRPQTSLRESRIGSIRGTSNQPSYNLFTGESTNNPLPPPPPPPRPGSRQGAPPQDNPYAQSQRGISRESSKENMAPPDADMYETQRSRIEELKAEVGTLRYTISTHEQEKEMARLQHETELRDVRRRAEEDFKHKQSAESERAAADRKVEALQAELDGLRGDKDSRQKEVDKKLREAQDEIRLLQEQLDDLSVAKDEEARMAERRSAALQGQVTAAQRTAQELEQESQAREVVLQKVQEQLAERDTAVGNLEAEVLRLKAQTGDAATMEVIRRELTDQVNHIRALEATNREQLVELKHLRQIHKSVEVVEEEKRTLQRRLEAAEALEKELVEARIQRQRLEDERQAWTAYLQNEASTNGQVEFDSPESMARALVQERYNSASLTEKLGRVEPEVAQRDAVIQSLESQKQELRTELDKLKSTGGGGGGGGGGANGSPAAGPGGADKARLRLERQRALAVKEVEYLRAQLKTFDTEDITFQPENFDQNKSQRIQDLEDLVDKYKEEIQKLHAELSSLESPSTFSTSISTPTHQLPLGSKRAHPGDGENEQVGQLARKNRKLQEDLATLQTAHRVLEKELAVSRSQLASAKEAAKTRVLSLRSNPTSDFEAIKMSTLSALRQENAELLAQVQGRPASFATIPMSVLGAAQREIAAAKAETASAEKSARRLKEVWSAKSAEFKEAIFSTLGWHVTFIPNGKMRVESVYHPSITDEHENSIVFDGERGTMKVAGGPQSPFAMRIADQIGFWVREKGCIPGFLAALTLEFYEEHTRAAAKPN